MGGGMTRDEIIGIAEQAGCGWTRNGTEPVLIGEESISRFAERVAAAEQERLNKKIAALEADVDHFFRLSGQYLERANKAEEAVAAERERCAQLCEAYAMPDGTSETALALAAAIRRMK